MELALVCIEGQGWFLSTHVFTRYLKVTFVKGASLRPIPPGSGKDTDARWVDIYEGELDEEQMTEWIRQAAGLPGWRGLTRCDGRFVVVREAQVRAPSTSSSGTGRSSQGPTGLADVVDAVV